jgi:hypothetical protein
LVQVVSQAEQISRRGGWKRAGQVELRAGDCLDLLHPGHIRLPQRANPLPDIRVAIASDAAARAPIVRVPLGSGYRTTLLINRILELRS